MDVRAREVVCERLGRMEISPVKHVSNLKYKLTMTSGTIP